MSQESLPSAVSEVKIVDNIHSDAGINVFKGTFDWKPAIHKYIEIYKAEPHVKKHDYSVSDDEIVMYTNSLKKYKGLPCNNICKLLEWKVETPESRLDAWREAAAAVEKREKREKDGKSGFQPFDANRTKIRITMEYCGLDLFDYFNETMHKLDDICFINTLLQIAHDVLSAIICLNNHELVHGNITIENIVISNPVPPSPVADQQHPESCHTIVAKLIAMDSIDYIDGKRLTAFAERGTNLFETIFGLGHVFYNVPFYWTSGPLLSNPDLTPEQPATPSGDIEPNVSNNLILELSKLVSMLPPPVLSFRKHLKQQQLWGLNKGYIDIFSWCTVFLEMLLKKFKKSFKNLTPSEELSQTLAYVKAYIFESLISDMCLPDIKIDDIPKDTSGIVIDVKYCENVKLFLLWLKSVSEVKDIPFPTYNRKVWWYHFKKNWRENYYKSGWSKGLFFGEALGGGYNKSNHNRSIRKNKHCLSKRLKKRKYKRTHKRKHKRTHKRKYKKTNKTIKF